ncbi:hypothetical protein C8Q73DRAFT_746540 [Cubamyces lactineus]|nr:hypothetical protein C8Q73DRAFT_746540 [Cubamyces lactineus]
MAPSNLQGLNIVHPIQPPNPYLSDADLLSVPPFPDLNAQLDLWTNLNFQSDEPLVSSRPGDSHKDSLDGKRGLDEGSEDDPERYNDADDDLSRSGIAETQAHENVVMGTVLPPTGVVHPAHPPANGANAQQLPNFDINSLLAGFGIDPFMAPPPPAPQTALPTNPANTIAQLLSMHAASFRPGPVASTQSVPATPVQPQQSQAPSPINATSTATATKRARTARTSVSSPSDVSQAASPVESPEDKSSATPLTAAEDKRRRNTAASARFRLKKKEREAALERKAKELEVRVGELEKECEALRRENGWLKGLVVGSQLQQIQPPSGADSASAGTKRPREEETK